MEKGKKRFVRELKHFNSVLNTCTSLIPLLFKEICKDFENLVNVKWIGTFSQVDFM